MHAGTKEGRLAVLKEMGVTWGLRLRKFLQPCKSKAKHTQ